LDTFILILFSSSTLTLSTSGSLYATRKGWRNSIGKILIHGGCDDDGVIWVCSTCVSWIWQEGVVGAGGSGWYLEIGRDFLKGLQVQPNPKERQRNEGTDGCMALLKMIFTTMALVLSRNPTKPNGEASFFL